jgi:hypothetical protein
MGNRQKRKYKNKNKNNRKKSKNWNRFEFSIHCPPKPKNLLKNLLKDYESNVFNYNVDYVDESYVPLIFSVENKDKVTIHSAVPSIVPLKKKWFGFFLNVHHKTYNKNNTTKNKKKMYELLTIIKKKKLLLTENNQKIFLMQNEKGKDGKTWERKVDLEESKSEISRLQNDNYVINEEIKKMKESIKNIT